MNVLVVGGTRFLGVHLTWRLLAAGHSVTLFNRGTRPDPYGVRVDRLQGDRATADFGRLLAGRRFDAAVDLAAYERPEVEEAVDALAACGVRHYVFISSGQVYLVRDGAPRPSREEDYDGPLMPQPPAEQAAARGEWAYGMGKRACEDALVEGWSARRFPATRIRMPIVYGPGDHSRRLEGYLWRLLDGGPVLLPGGGAGLTRHVYVGDVARTIVDLLGDERAFGHAYNLCQRETPSLAELLALLGGLLGARADLVAIDDARLAEAGLDRRAVSPFSTRWASLLDPSRAEADLRFRATPLHEALRATVDAFLAAVPAAPPPGYERRAAERTAAEASR